MVGAAGAMAALPLAAESQPMSADVQLARPASMHPTRGYSQFARIKTGDVVYFAGQVPLDSAGALVGPSDFKAQLERVFANLDLAARAAGGSCRDIVKLNYFCVESVDPALLRHVSEVRDRYVDIERPPASTFVFVSRLVRPEWLVEVEAVGVFAETSA